MQTSRILDNIDQPSDLKKLDYGQLEQLASEIRDLLIERIDLVISFA